MNELLLLVEDQDRPLTAAEVDQVLEQTNAHANAAPARVHVLLAEQDLPVLDVLAMDAAGEHGSVAALRAGERAPRDDYRTTHRHLRTMVEQLRRNGLEASGTVVAHDPVPEAAEAVEDRHPTTVLVLAGRHPWAELVHRDWVHRVARASHARRTHLTVDRLG